MMGITRLMSVTRDISSQASSTWSMSAMSAMEQPALRSGRSTCWWSAGQHVGRLGHEVHAAEDDELGLGRLGRHAGQPEGVAPGVGPAHHVVTLVVVAEHVEPATQRGLGRADHVRASSSAVALL